MNKHKRARLLLAINALEDFISAYDGDIRQAYNVCASSHNVKASSLRDAVASRMFDKQNSTTQKKENENERI